MTDKCQEELAARHLCPALVPASMHVSVSPLQRPLLRRRYRLVNGRVRVVEEPLPETLFGAPVIVEGRP